MKFLLLGLLSFGALAGIKHAPTSFMANNYKVQYIDIIQAQYDLKFDIEHEEVYVTTQFEFNQKKEGSPFFDLVNTPQAVYIDGVKVGQKLISTPNKKSKGRIATTTVSAGSHTMVIESKLVEGVRFQNERRSWGNVSAGFFIRDLKDRMFLEQYLPTNLEFDQYKMIMNVEVIGTKRHHSLFVNGSLTKITENNFTVEFPDFYTASSVFFHLVPINRFTRWYLTYPSIDGRGVPVIIYSGSRLHNKYLKEKAWNVLAELEADYGAYPHDQLIIYGSGLKGGMEHAGATETSLISLGHELQHMWFAKGIHPANGNSGWLDEAIASWRDKGHQSHEKPFYESVNLGAHSPYTRKTDKRSYEYGRSFMAYLDFTLKDIGRTGLKDFLRTFFENRKYTTVTTEDFKTELEDYAQMSFGEDFNQYIYGGTVKNKNHKHHNLEEDFENPHHPKVSKKELNSII